MDNLDILYRDIIIEHSERVFDEEIITDSSAITLYNHGCGDSVVIAHNDKEIWCFPRGCTICKASTSMMKDYIAQTNNPDIASVKKIITKGVIVNDFKDFDIAALAGVSQFPNRIKCALLPWEALESVLK